MLLAATALVYRTDEIIQVKIDDDGDGHNYHDGDDDHDDGDDQDYEDNHDYQD